MKKKSPVRKSKSAPAPADLAASPARARVRKAAKRQRLPAAERREQVLGAAQKVFIRQGFHGTRTRDLAEEAGVNEATLFLYFKSKEDIFEAAVTEPLKALVKLEMLKGAAFATADTAEGKAAAGTQGIREIYKAVSGLSPLLVAALLHDPEKGRALYRRDIYPMIRELRTAARLSFRLQDDDEAEFIALAAFGLCFALHVHGELIGEEAPVDALASRIARLFQQGAIRNGS